MSSSKRPRPAPEDLIEDAILDDILASSEDEIAAELRDGGSSPDEAVARARRAVADAEAECGRRRLAAAKRGVAAFRSSAPVVSLADVQRQRTSTTVAYVIVACSGRWRLVLGVAVSRATRRR